MFDLKRRAKHSAFHYTGGEGDHCWNAHHSSSLLGIEVILLLELSWQLNYNSIAKIIQIFAIEFSSNIQYVYNIYIQHVYKMLRFSSALQLFQSVQ